MAARRADFRDLPEPDAAATAIAVKAVARRDRVAALRAVLLGSAVTQTVAAKWVGDSRCPRCQLEDEDWHHKFWRCPAAAAARLRYGFEAEEPDKGPIGRGSYLLMPSWSRRRSRQARACSRRRSSCRMWCSLMAACWTRRTS